jgi:hypothetical protein
LFNFQKTPPLIREGHIIIPIMDCPEKQALQRRCTAAWEAYEAEMRKAGLYAGTRIPSERKYTRMGVYLHPHTRKLAASPVVATAPFLRREHLRISAELSRHLSSHRC